MQGTRKDTCSLLHEGSCLRNHQTDYCISYMGCTTKKYVIIIISIALLNLERHYSVRGKEVATEQYRLETRKEADSL